MFDIVSPKFDNSIPLSDSRFDGFDSSSNEILNNSSTKEFEPTKNVTEVDKVKTTVQSSPAENGTNVKPLKFSEDQRIAETVASKSSVESIKDDSKNVTQESQTDQKSKENKSEDLTKTPERPVNEGGLDFTTSDQFVTWIMNGNHNDYGQSGQILFSNNFGKKPF